jgi:hypothetical protein
LGCADETWWDRIFQADIATWGEHPEHLITRSVADKQAPERSRACYGLLLQHPMQEVWIRLAARRPISALTIDFLAWALERLAARGIRVLALIWDRAAWHASKIVRRWVRDHNRQVKATGIGVRLLPLLLPSQSPWLNPIEPYWAHAKRCIVEPTGSLSLEDLTTRVYAHFHAEPLPLLSDHVS